MSIDLATYRHCMCILCRGDEVIVRINGVEVNREMDCTESAGAIAFQSEGAPIELRNARVRGLEHVSGASVV